ncbi:hypothetical protein PALA53_00590 [Pseudomonas aeruginosa]|nr:EcoKMrr [Pseudomonas aeruginosa]RCM14230.1 EcoKMrr [Pseudomonas aeruginosa]WBI35752.1 hypothetical protein PALA25_00590 [Pseudomonas aeruginosa]WBJ02301.1 hypothetical protein PALA53_00590 [Pseudomonas aeruginosa]
MSVPTYDQFIEPILRYLAATPEGATARDAHEAAADALNLSEAQRQELITSGQATYKNRAGWAHDRLKRAGLSSSAKRGYWKLTDAGITYAAQHPAPLTADKVEQLAIGFMDVKLKSPTDAIPLDGQEQAVPALSSATVSPDDRLRELREATAADLNLLQVSPNRFEVIVLDVLHRLGYGASRNDLQRVGSSGDGGDRRGDLTRQARSGKSLRSGQTLARHGWPARTTSLLWNSCKAEGQAWRIYHHLRLHSPSNRLFSFGGRHGSGRRQPTGKADDGSRGGGYIAAT